MHITIIEQFNGPPESGVGDPLVVRPLKIRGIPFMDEGVQAGPTCESVLPSNGQLTITQGECCGSDRVIRCSGVAWMKFSDSLTCLECARRLFGQQLLGLMLQLIDVGTRR